MAGIKSSRINRVIVLCTDFGVGEGEMVTTSEPRAVGLNELFRYQGEKV